MSVRFLLLSALMGLLAACATAPRSIPSSGPEVSKDDYDGATIVRQMAVPAGTLGESDFNALGFEWRSKFANRVVLVAGTRGVIRVAGLTLDVDGAPVAVKVASETTAYGDPSSGERWSMRRFEIDWESFERLAAGGTVRMRIIGPNEMYATSFGHAVAAVPVNRTLADFRATVRKLRGERAE